MNRRTRRRLVWLGVTLFVAVDVAVIFLVEWRDRGPSGAARAPSSAGRGGAPSVVDAPPVSSPSKVALPAAAAASSPASPFHVPLPVAIPEPSAPPPFVPEPFTTEEGRAAAQALLDALRTNDAEALKRMEPPDVAADIGTTRKFEHDARVAKLREVLPRLDEVVRAKGIQSVVAMRGNDVRIRLYGAESGKTSGEALVLRKQAGQWYVVSTTYMRDEP